MAKTFKDMNIPENIISALKKSGITSPTDVQYKTYEPFLEKKDLIVKSETGTGKTLSYLLPLFALTDTSLRAAQSIIITPTHELSSQVFKEAEKLIKNSGSEIRTGLFIGGASFLRQVENIKKNKPHIVIGSSGRILDLIKKRKLSVHHVKSIVIDEADRLTDDLNFDDIRDIIKCTLKERQVTLFSASFNDEVKERMSTLMKEPLFISAAKGNTLPETLTHYYIKAELREKFSVLKKILAAEKPKKAVIFINNPVLIEATVNKLNYGGFNAYGLCGNVSDTARKNALEKFRYGKNAILVSGDLGARGLDIKDVTHIINLDIPEDTNFYLHRAGRTGRLNKKGSVISIITQGEKKWINKYKRTFNIEIKEKTMSFGKLADVKENNKKHDKYQKNDRLK